MKDPCGIYAEIPRVTLVQEEALLMQHTHVSPEFVRGATAVLSWLGGLGQPPHEVLAREYVRLLEGDSCH